MSELKGIVLKSTGSWYEVLTSNEQKVLCRLRGIFRLDTSREKDSNPVAVGDEVILSEEQKGEFVIAEIKDRKNYIVRTSPKHKGARQVIAANLDQAVLVVTLSSPRTSSGFIDRFLVTAEAYHIPTILVFNKQDDIKSKHQEKQNRMIEDYENAGYTVVKTSSVSKEGLEQLKKILQHKVTLISGHSGVGKSTLVNALQPELNLRTGQISVVHDKGMHTTTFAEMHKLNFDGFIIDTPGIKEFGITDFEPKEIGHYFIEFRSYLHQCKYNDCTHYKEPDCAVRTAVLEGKISEERYKNYLNILVDYTTDFKHWE